MDPGRDPALASRFLGWLQARREPLPSTAAIARLNELSAWDATPGDLAARTAGAPDAAALLGLHAQWLRFRQTLPADWVELSGESAGVTWVGPDDDLLRPAPPGPVPELVAGERPAVVRLRRRRAAWDTAFIVATALLLIALPAVRSAWSARRTAAELLDLADSTSGARRYLWASALRIHQQRVVSLRLVRTRLAQRSAVSKTCEGGEECRARLAHLDAALLAARRIEELSHDTRGVAATMRPSTPVWPAVITLEREELVRREAAETDESRRRVLKAEIAAIEAELLLP